MALTRCGRCFKMKFNEESNECEACGFIRTSFGSGLS